MTTNKDFREFQKFLLEQKLEQVNEGVLGSALKRAGEMAAGTAAVSGGVAAGQTAAQGGSKDDVVKAGIEGAKSIVTEPIRKYKEGDKWGAATDVLKTISGPAVLADVGRVGAQTGVGRSVGKWIGDNVPGAKAAAEAAKKFRSAIGMKSEFEPEEPETPKEPDQSSTEVTPRKVQSVAVPSTSDSQPSSSSSEITPRKVKTTVEPESGGRRVKTFKQFHKNK